MKSIEAMADISLFVVIIFIVFPFLFGNGALAPTDEAKAVISEFYNYRERGILLKTFNGVIGFHHGNKFKPSPFL
jgi:hypothetical protein